MQCVNIRIFFFSQRGKFGRKLYGIWKSYATYVVHIAGLAFYAIVEFSKVCNT